MPLVLGLTSNVSLTLSLEEKTGSSRRRNKPTRSTMKGSCQAVAVEWEKEALHPTLPEKAFDLIVVCDCLYENRDSWAALQLLLERLPAEASGEPSGEPAVLLASAALRKPFLEAFVAQLAKAKGSLCSRSKKEATWEKFAPPSCNLRRRSEPMHRPSWRSRRIDASRHGDASQCSSFWLKWCFWMTTFYDEKHQVSLRRTQAAQLRS
ncbi:unnamed protein product [Durusdinium trenchii]|uniref:Calmodulin-lysine N-methyltransferase n=1 Tax=Durusdinium trenchii TaxID=1381693 RepID=A0ABP0RQG6_9DINO